MSGAILSLSRIRAQQLVQKVLNCPVKIWCAMKVPLMSRISSGKGPSGLSLSYLSLLRRENDFSLAKLFYLAKEKSFVQAIDFVSNRGKIFL